MAKETAQGPKGLTEHVAVLAEHYQKTFELADGLRKDRNRYFVFLVLFLAGSSLVFILGKTVVLQVLVIWIGHSIGLPDGTPTTLPGIITLQDLLELMLKENFDIYVLLALTVVFYLMMNLYHHTVTVRRLYAYLEAMEKEIGANLTQDREIVSFTREGKFYKAHNSPWLKSIGLSYSIVLTFLLVGFFSLVAQDMQFIVDPANLGVTGLRLAELGIGIAIFIYLIGYWLLSLGAPSGAKLKERVSRLHSYRVSGFRGSKDEG